MIEFLARRLLADQGLTGETAVHDAGGHELNYTIQQRINHPSLPERDPHMTLKLLYLFSFELELNQLQETEYWENMFEKVVRGEGVVRANEIFVQPRLAKAVAWVKKVYRAGKLCPTTRLFMTPPRVFDTGDDQQGGGVDEGGTDTGVVGEVGGGEESAEEDGGGGAERENLNNLVLRMEHCSKAKDVMELVLGFCSKRRSPRLELDAPCITDGPFKMKYSEKDVLEFVRTIGSRTQASGYQKWLKSMQRNRSALGGDAEYSYDSDEEREDDDGEGEHTSDDDVSLLKLSFLL